MKKLLTFFFLFIACKNFASHNMAGEISYKFIGTTPFPYKYEITVTTYTDWVGPSGTDRCELVIHFGDGDSAIAPRVNGISTNCPSTADGVLTGGCVGS